MAGFECRLNCRAIKVILSQASIGPYRAQETRTRAILKAVGWERAKQGKSTGSDGCQAGKTGPPHACNDGPLRLWRKGLEADFAVCVVWQVRVHRLGEVVVRRIADTREVQTFGMRQSPAPMLLACEFGTRVMTSLWSACLKTAAVNKKATPRDRI